MAQRRFTQRLLEAQAETASRMTGQRVIIYAAYGGYGVHIRHEDTSQTDLMGGALTAREASRFLAGMISAARLLERTETR